MSKKVSKKNNKSVKKNNTVVVSADDKKKKRKNRLFVFFTFFASAVLAAILVVGVMHCVKACNKQEEDERINIYVKQPQEVEGWELTVNDCSTVAKANKGDTLKILVAPQNIAQWRQALLKDNPSNFDPEFYIRVSDHAKPEKILTEIKLLKQADESYAATTIMAWDYEIDVEAFAKATKESYVYSLEGTKLWRYDEATLSNASSDVLRESDTGEEEWTPRADFNEELWVGKKVTWLPDGFLNHLPSLNKQVHLEEAEKLTELPGDFMLVCEAYNQPIQFNDSLKTIYSGFMSYCTSFNHELHFNKVEKLLGARSTTETNFLYNCTSFNSVLDFGSNMQAIGDNFMCNCSAFNQSFTLPSTLTNFGANFMLMCTQMCSTITIDCPVTYEVFPGGAGTLSVIGAAHKEDPLYSIGVTVQLMNQEYLDIFRLQYPELIGEAPSDVYRHLTLQIKP